MLEGQTGVIGLWDE